MHHARVDDWSRRTSYLHSRDPRAKLIALLIYLIILATTPLRNNGWFFTAQMLLYAAILVCGIVAARLPFVALPERALVVLPFALTFGIVSWAAGDPGRAVLLVPKSYLSALAVLLVVATTPMPRLLSGIESLGAPRMFVLAVQFLYRYLFVLSEQAQHMRLAAACRAGEGRSNQPARFRSATGAVSVLFARSYARADGIHRAMLSRGFEGRLVSIASEQILMADLVFASGLIAACCAVRLSFTLA